MPLPVSNRLVALLCVLVLHVAAVLGWATAVPVRPAAPRPAAVLTLRVLPATVAAADATRDRPPVHTAPRRAEPRPQASPRRVPPPSPQVPAAVASPRTALALPPDGAASMAAPPPPSAADWAFAARYPLKNAKPYRHFWGRQVRSQMGTAVAGPDQGAVRLRVEIAPDGRLLRLDTLWSTSAVAERLARAAVAAMPPLPPTPTGLPLVFEQTISFQPHETDGPPVYRHDCRPDPPVFRNAFAWNGQHTTAPRARVAEPPAVTAPTLSHEDCLKLLPPDTPDAEAAHDRHLIEQGRSSRLRG